MSDSWTRAASYQKTLYVIAAILAVSGLVHGVILLATGGTLSGPVSWRKPMAFGISFALSCASVGWILGHLPRAPVRGWIIGGFFSLAALGSAALITLQQWRGVPSHFNQRTLFDATIFNLMGSVGALLVVSVLPLTIWVFVSLRTPG